MRSRPKSGVDVAGAKRLLYAAAAAGAAMLGAMIGLAKLRISPDALFSVNDWTAYVIFITVIGGIGRIEGPILGTIIFFALRETLSDLGPAYLIALGAVASLRCCLPRRASTAISPTGFIYNCSRSRAA